MCGKTYSYFIWAMGSDRCLCRKCVDRRPQSVLDGIDDGIDLNREQDQIYEEIEEQNRKGFRGNYISKLPGNDR